jgi:hypothetical protein
MTPSKQKVEEENRKTNFKRKDIGSQPKTRGIIGSSSYTINTLSTSICEEWTKFSRQWPCSWAPGKLSNVEAITKKWKKNSILSSKY